MSDRFRIAAATGLCGLLLLTWGCEGNAPDGDEATKNAGDTSQQAAATRLRTLEPSCGRFDSGFIRDASGKAALSPVMQKRMATSAADHSRWSTKVVEVVGESFDRGFVTRPGSGLNRGALGLAMASEEIPVGGKMTREGFAACLLQKMSVLYDAQGNLIPDTAQRLLRRMESISRQEIAAWEASFEKVLGEDVNGFNVVLSLVVDDGLYTDEHYDAQVAARRRRRLDMLTRADVDSWLEAVAAFRKTGLDAPMGITLFDEVFPNERFDRAMFHSALEQHASPK